jgi:hypothetical protein
MHQMNGPGAVIVDQTADLDAVIGNDAVVGKAKLDIDELLSVSALWDAEPYRGGVWVPDDCILLECHCRKRVFPSESGRFGPCVASPPAGEPRAI